MKEVEVPAAEIAVGASLFSPRVLGERERIQRTKQLTLPRVRHTLGRMLRAALAFLISALLFALAALAFFGATDASALADPFFWYALVLPIALGGGVVGGLLYLHLRAWALGLWPAVALGVAYGLAATVAGWLLTILVNWAFTVPGHDRRLSEALSQLGVLLLFGLFLLLPALLVGAVAGALLGGVFSRLTRSEPACKRVGVSVPPAG
jgi:hypothetical protein